jgi:ABC-2 type transport system permease protein
MMRFFRSASSPFRALAVLRAVAFATYKEWAAYRSHMLVSLFVGPVFFLVQVFIWQAVFSSRTTLNGLTLSQMLMYYGVSAIIYYLIMDFADWNLQMLIHTGRFLTFMLRPVSHRFFALSQKVGHRMLGFILEFIPVYLLFYFVFKIRLWPVFPLWAVISILLSFIMMFLVDYCVGISAFWLTRTGGVRRMFFLLRDICAGTLLPLTFFPGPLQKVLFVLPFQFITYVPVRVFLGSYELAGISLPIPQIVGLQALAVLGMLAVSEILWRLGIRKFTGVGA